MLGVLEPVVGDAAEIDLMRVVAAAGEADIGLARLARAVDDAADDRSVIGVVMWASRSSSASTVSMTSKCCRAQDGQEMTVTPRWRRPSDFSMSKPTLTSSTGSADSETRIVSPMPAHSSMPMPIDDLTVPLQQAAGLGDAEMQRVVARLGQLLIGGDGQEHVGRLHGDLELEEVVVLEDLGVVERALDHRLGAGLAVFLEQVALQRAGIDADAHRAAVILGRLDHLAHPLGRADIAGIDAQAGGAALGRLDGALVVEMDVGDDRHLRPARTMSFSASVDSSSGQETRTMSAPASLQRLDLLDRRLDVVGERVGHRLHGDRRVAADRHLADMDLAAGAAVDVAIGANAHSSASREFCDLAL